MPRNTYFVQECSTCGRNLQVRVEYMGKKVVCQHCGAKFLACTPDANPALASDSLLARADQLLQSAEASGIGARNATHTA